MRARRVAVTAAGLAVLLLAAGCATPFGAAGGAGAGADTGNDGRIGVESGYRYDDPVSVTTEDGLNESERAAVTARAMARLERLRGLEFTGEVPVRLINRTQYRANQSGAPNATHSRWNNQVWEGLFLVGEDRNVSAVFERTLGSSVLGYYSPSDREIVVVSDGDTPQLRRSTLVHELVHALQDQQFGLNDSADTQDRQLVRSSVIEGEAVLLTERYASRCDSEWDCVSVGGGGGGGAPDPGVFLVVIQPYTSGPNFVRTIESRGGWEAVDALHGSLPDSTEQIVHPELYPDERPVNVTVPDRARSGWHRFEHDPVADTVGEASIFAMVLDNDVGDESVSRYSYDHPASSGWGGDSLVPYRQGDRFGYVWATAWDTERDARQFHEVYLELLASRGAVERSDGVYVIPDGPFADAFRVTREGNRVRIVNGPDTAALDAIHPR